MKAIKEAPKTYEVWLGNWQDGPNSHGEMLLGKADANSFEEAARSVCGNSHSMREGVPTSYGVRVFPTEQEASQSFQDSGYFKIAGQ